MPSKSSKTEEPRILSCIKCHYFTSKQCNFAKHLLTTKHKKTTNTDEDVVKSSNSFVCLCGNKYKHRQSLFNHKLKCKFTNNPVTTECTVLTTTNQNTVQPNNELLMELLKQNNELQKQIIEMAREPKTVNNNNTNNIQLNINQFLNETCKNAINFSEFIENIQVTYDDLENNVKLGFVDGVTKIIMDNLKQLAISDRPIHCTDVKRETIYVKQENQWDKETSHAIIQKGFQNITCKNMQQLVEWREENPSYADDIDSELGEKSIVMQQNLMAGTKREEFYPKIIKNIAKETILDKKRMLE